MSRADGVFSGGGVKGIAFAGALEAAAEAGYDEWSRLGGTSAGAIAAAALAVGYGASGVRSLLETTDFADFDDGGWLPGRIRALWRRGWARGRVLHEWIRDLLRNAPAPAERFGELDGRLQVVGVDVAHSRLVVFPDDVGMYADEQGRPLEPDDYPIADAVRISAGFPYFFPPLVLRDHATGRDGALVDGGVASSFPVFLFDRPDPRWPTWGFRLHAGRGAAQPSHRAIRPILWPYDMGRGILDTAMNAFDRRGMRDFGDRVISIPTGDVPTLDFTLSAEQREYLRRSGYDAAKAHFAARPTAVNRFGQEPPLAGG